MFRSSENPPPTRHYFLIALFLSFISGLVNVVGLASIKVLTTNITGHFTLLIGEVYTFNVAESLVYLLFLFSFFMGAFSANFFMEVHLRRTRNPVFTVPVIIEIVILAGLAIEGNRYKNSYPDMVACALLFVMGLQNSLATRITNATVRTTHLTGLFTDLGMECAQFFFKKTSAHEQRIRTSIAIKLLVIVSFFSGGILGFLSYAHLGFGILSCAALILTAGLVHDYVG